MGLGEQGIGVPCRVHRPDDDVSTFQGDPGRAPGWAPFERFSDRPLRRHRVIEAQGAFARPDPIRGRVGSTTINEGRPVMADSVYRVTEVIGVSSESWEAAARNAVETAAKTVRDLRVAEVLRQDVTIENGSLVNFRVRLAISFKYETGD